MGTGFESTPLSRFGSLQHEPLHFDAAVLLAVRAERLLPAAPTTSMRAASSCCRSMSRRLISFARFLLKKMRAALVRVIARAGATR